MYFKAGIAVGLNNGTKIDVSLERDNYLFHDKWYISSSFNTKTKTFRLGAVVAANDVNIIVVRRELDTLLGGFTISINNTSS